jgi:hypothetical protein
MYGRRLLLVNSDAFYQPLPHALDLSDDCGLIQGPHPIPSFCLSCSTHNIQKCSNEVQPILTWCTGVEEYRSLTLNGLGVLNPGSQTPPILSPPKQS